eukprot:CAMPEP_0168333108 /NCGR_PEP_ID=MMETSP0213-20121227/9388_1 /TAXON_ID=151035 /ORGANISM="Euplotes harpa, Strain FSP1.4" /LENGTH=104 /DNA_ID=CAMNT_0008337323 /DNA_START=39 /DNA_END=350 /DNA_ORIENTATION=+
MRSKNTLRLAKAAAYNNEIINDLRAEMEVINQSLIEKQFDIQQELLKQISLRKQMKVLESEGTYEPSTEKSTEMTEMMNLIKENFGLIKSECDRLNDERDFFKN